MTMLKLIEKKKRGKNLSKAELDYFVKGVTEGSIPDYQTSAFLMAVYFQGMDHEETAFLTLAMANSGEKTDISGIDGILVDKHSTGGVSDSTTLILTPVLACMGLKVLKASGRGLGFTGGTIDKLESIPNIKTELTALERKEIVNKCGAVISSAGKDLAPCDRILYALRDVTATVDSLPLIASSVMSKKLAGGSHIILLDVKYGSGAFMKSKEKALELSKLMAEIGKRAGTKTACVVSSMNQPLSPYVGSNQELRPVVGLLKGEGKKSRLYKVSKELTRRIASLAGLKNGESEFDKFIDSGEAFEKLCQMVSLQGGDVNVLKDLTKLPDSPHVLEVKAKMGGFVKTIDSEGIGNACVILGGGRQKKTDVIDHGAGLVFELVIGKKIEQGQTIATLYTSDPAKLSGAAELIENCYTFSDKSVTEEPLFYCYTDGESEEYYEDKL